MKKERYFWPTVYVGTVSDVKWDPIIKSTWRSDFTWKNDGNERAAAAVESVLRETRINYNVYRMFSGPILRGANIGRRYMHNIVKPGSPSLCTEGLVHDSHCLDEQKQSNAPSYIPSLQLSMCGYMFLLPGVCFYEKKRRRKERQRD